MNPTREKAPKIWTVAYPKYGQEHNRVAVARSRDGQWQVMDYRTRSSRYDLSLPPGSHRLAVTYADFLSRRAPAHDRL